MSFRCQKLGEQIVAIVDASSGNMQLVNTETNQTRPLSITTPEIEVGRAAVKAHMDRWYALPAAYKVNRTPANLTVVYATAADSQGRLYLAIGSHKVSEGAPVARIDQAGSVTGRFRFSVAGATGTQPTDTQPFAPYAMAVIANQLFVTDGHGRVVVHQLP